MITFDSMSYTMLICWPKLASIQLQLSTEWFCSPWLLWLAGRYSSCWKWKVIGTQKDSAHNIEFSGLRHLKYNIWCNILHKTLDHLITSILYVILLGSKLCNTGKIQIENKLSRFDLLSFPSLESEYDIEKSPSISQEEGEEKFSWVLLLSYCSTNT
jgi:hypothetical protein